MAVTRPRIGRFGPLLTLAFLAPVVMLFAISVTYMSWNSVEGRKLFRGNEFVGAANYIRVLGDSGFWQSVRFGTLWAAATVALQTGIGLALALILNEVIPLRHTFRALVFIPYLVTVPVVGVLATLLFSGSYGVLAISLQHLGLAADWYDSDHAPFLLTVAAVWRYAPFSMLIFLAGLQGIPEELYEAAKVDGAGAVRRFVHVTIPGLHEALFIAILLRSIWMFNKFDLPWLLTQGGPFGATTNVPVYIYRQAFERFDLGSSSAAGVALLLIVVLVVWAHFRIDRRWGASQ